MTEAGWTRNNDAAETYADKAAIEAIWHVRGAHKLTCDEHENLQQDFKDVAQEAYRQGRVEGLREAVPLACKYCNDRTKWTPMSNSGYHVCNMPEPGFVRCQAIKIHAALAQQAQEGANNERT